jgi:hypothetical protein
MEDLGHSKSGLTILKVDTEGSEWDAFSAFFGSKAVEALVSKGGIKQLLVEWHWDPDSRYNMYIHTYIHTYTYTHAYTHA